MFTCISELLKIAHYCPPSSRNNLITIQCSNRMTADRCKQQLVACNINAQSVRNKSAVTFCYICDHTPSIVTLTEHWLTDLDSSVRAELCPNGYKILDHTRSDRRGGGTGIIYHESLGVKKIDAGVSVRNSYEFSEWIVKSGGYSIRIAIIYRPPYSERHPVTTNVFLTEFPDYLESLLLCKERLLTTGDFNIHVDDCRNPDTQKFLDLLDSFDLQQHVKQPTHRDGHTLDLSITRKSETLVDDEPTVDLFISDHEAVFTRLGLSRQSPPTEKSNPPTEIKTTTYRKIKSINLDSFHSDIQACSLCDDKQFHTADDLDAYAREYTTTLSALLDRHAPLKTRRRVTRPVVPWYIETIDNAKRERKKAERKWRKTKAADYLLDFKSKRNHVTYLMNKARRDFYSEFLVENGADQRKLFNAGKKLLCMKDEPLFAEHLDKNIIANDIDRYFVRKVENICNEIDATPISQSDRDLVPPDKPVVDANVILRSFRNLSEQDIYYLILKSAKTSCVLDPLPTTVVCD